MYETSIWTPCFQILAKTMSVMPLLNYMVSRYSAANNVNKNHCEINAQEKVNKLDLHIQGHFTQGCFPCVQKIVIRGVFLYNWYFLQAFNFQFFTLPVIVPK